MRYPFAPRLARAKELGVSTAAVYDRLYDLCLEQAKEHADYHDGCHWVRMAYKDFPRIFPYLSAGTVSKALKRLRDEGLVRKVRHGRISWYTIV